MAKRKTKRKIKPRRTKTKRKTNSRKIKSKVIINDNMAAVIVIIILLILAYLAINPVGQLYRSADATAPGVVISPGDTNPFGITPRKGSTVSDDVTVKWYQTDFGGRGIANSTWVYRKIGDSNYNTIFSEKYSTAQQGEGVKSFVFPASNLPSGEYEIQAFMTDGKNWVWTGMGKFKFYRLTVSHIQPPPSNSTSGNSTGSGNITTIII